MSERRKILDLFEEQKDFWEARVASGIEQHRKGDGRIKLVDQNGKPLSGVKVKLTQKSHQFRFGANIFMLDELETEEKNVKVLSNMMVDIKGTYKFIIPITTMFINQNIEKRVVQSRKS